ncbi:MAG: replication-associated recombination protein A [Candidatus Omnitrophica bacterium]|jgi:putative ATPase|nr:replication-associated recombination protein A [Candidatus Omnitrophota bacterium]
MLQSDTPLAIRLRPKTLEDFIGQKHILGEGKLLKRAIIAKRLPSLIFHGPAGCGKTTLGLIVSQSIDADFIYLNASFTSSVEVRKIILNAKKILADKGRKTILFIDEIHRFNKLQQESLVPDTESANINLIGATIYNPYYYLIPSLISRAIVAEFKPLAKEDIITILKRALLDKENGLGNMNIVCSDEAIEHIAVLSAGDARKALGSLEIGALSTKEDSSGKINLDLNIARESIQKNIFYDKKDSYHYDTISAFIKSVRGSDVDSALYWLAKMIKSGEDPRFIARRIVILASEDIGNANPFALVLATSAFKAVEFIGKPESDLILAQATIYLAGSPKSNSAYLAIDSAKKDIEEEETKEVPKNIKTHSKDYKYPHSFGGFVEQDYGARNKYYLPKDIGEEKKIKEFLDNLHKNK